MTTSASQAGTQRPPTRVYGMETEFGIAAVPLDGELAAPQEAATGEGADEDEVFGPEEAARLLFEPALTYRRSSNRFLPNGSRLYLDIGAHPEYAGAECSDPHELLANDRAGEEIYRDLVRVANRTLAEREHPARIHLFKNNADSEGTSFGSHENYLIHRGGNAHAVLEGLISFLVSRQILTGSGYVRTDEDGRPSWSFSVRSDLVWDTVSKATTKTRPMINSRDEPHADGELYRRLHVIVGDSTIAQPTTSLRFAMTSLVLDALEAGVAVDDLALAEPTTAIRDVAHDISARAPLQLASGGTVTAIDLQEEYLTRVLRHVEAEGGADGLSRGLRDGLDLWQRGVAAFRAGDLDPLATEIDWVAKHRLVERYRERGGLELDDPRVTRLLLAYHDVTGDKPLARTLEERGGLRAIISPEAAQAARTTPPQTTRAAMRGAAVTTAENRKRDLFVDWVNLRMDFTGIEPVELEDPFATTSPRVDAMIAAIEALPLGAAHGPLDFG